MQTNVIDYLNSIADSLPNKVAFADETTKLTFNEVYGQGRSIGSFLHSIGVYREPVVILMDKNPKTIVAFLGTIYGGNYYIPLDQEMGQARIKMIIEEIKPKAIIYDETKMELLESMDINKGIYPYQEIVNTPVNEKILHKIQQKHIDTDPMYVVYTSGSTGVPKGVVACHRSVINYIENLSNVLGINESNIFGMQVPLYFDACLKEIFLTLKHGATTYIIPKKLFMFPVKLIEFLNKYEINTICWVVTALTIISGLNTLDSVKPKFLHTIAFGSEIFPIKHLNKWRKALPASKFINLYGPTEGTGMCCYYIVEREFDEQDTLPIGKPFRNTEILLLDEENNIVPEGEVGEICIRGTAVTHGYYNDFSKTAKAFVQNPLNLAYPEIIYRTGDLAKLNHLGELVLTSRKDHQIKHLGYRIELGEIETFTNNIEGITRACCIYDKNNSKLLLFYTGELMPKELVSILRDKLPKYMIPSGIYPLDTLPVTANGKIDRITLASNYIK